MSDEKIMVCMPVAKAVEVVEGSIAKACAVCGAQVWLSPQTASRALPGERPTIWCLDCFARDPHRIEISPPSHEELDAVIAAIRRYDRRQGH